MEMGSDLGDAKRMNLAAPGIHEVAPPMPATPTPEAIDLEAMVVEKSAEPPPGAEKDEGQLLDHISCVSDHILGEIISLLPLKEGARTQVLSSRWRHLWRHAPLNLDFRGLPASDNMLSSRCVLVSDILAAHKGSGRRLCLPGNHIQCRADALDAWLRSPALNNLQELEFYFYGKRYCAPDLVLLLPPPASIFRCSSTLRVAIISNCYLTDDAVETLRFKQLRRLALVHVKISEVSLHKIISTGCPGLECLLLSTISGVRCHRINSPTLRSIGICSSSDELIIEDAPSLESLLYPEMNKRMKTTVISAPKLETLGCIPEKYRDSRIVFGSTVIQAGLRIDSLTTVVRTVKILAIHMPFFDQDTVIDLMRCFPCLEKLYAKEANQPCEQNRWNRKNWNLLTSLDFRLRTIVLRCYCKTYFQVNFATFFMLNSRMLETMRLEVASCNYNEHFFAEQHEMLQMEKRASRGARLCFTTGCHHEVSGTMHLDDLDSTDPFDCGC
ncbi:putative FBD-associated F-box protein At5g56440 [Lolium perenne]|uniref:putative FBD-associated F-box protein At5g56440 n=1 Tax=Lolium perenne TaxID=4522 RepID=UPI0021F65309|nr:putative F-box/FBD/LRR-repeat protein At1g78840 [Lolium perenne]